MINVTDEKQRNQSIIYIFTKLSQKLFCLPVFPDQYLCFITLDFLQHQKSRCWDRSTQSHFFMYAYVCGVGAIEAIQYMYVD